MHPFINLSSLSDEALLEKIQKCRNMLSRSQHNQDLAHSIENMLDSYEAEYQERMFREKMGEVKNEAIEIGKIYGDDDEEQ